MRNPIVRVLVIILGCLAVPGVARAQSAIAGQVTDTTGAVLPGVTVEATSPSLIGGARNVVTDGQGRYAIEQIPAGPYKVTFTLSGFSTLIRDGIESGGADGSAWVLRYGEAVGGVVCQG